MLHSSFCLVDLVCGVRLLAYDVCYCCWLRCSAPLLPPRRAAWLQCMSLFSRSNGELARYKAKPALVSIVQQPVGACL